MRALLIPATDSPTLVEIGEEAEALAKARALIGTEELAGFTVTDPTVGMLYAADGHGTDNIKATIMANYLAIGSARSVAGNALLLGHDPDTGTTSASPTTCSPRPAWPA